MANFIIIMKIFYGAAIQGAKDRGERAAVNRYLIDLIRKEGYEVVGEHTTGTNREETAQFLERTIGPLPPPGIERTHYVRRKMIELVEGDIAGAVFEVSVPSLGTGIEIAHAYLRPRRGLPEIPILGLYQRDYWPNRLSSMVLGISEEELPNFQLKVYADLEEAEQYILQFFRKLRDK